MARMLIKTILYQCNNEFFIKCRFNLKWVANLHTLFILFTVASMANRSILKEKKKSVPID